MTDQLPRPRDVEFQLAPEVLNPREFGDVSYAADLYSLGMSVIALLSGKQKFWTLFRGLSKSQRNDPMAWARWQASSENLPPMAQLFPNASPQLTFTLDKLIQKSVHDRVASADEAFSMLRALETHSSSIAEPATVHQQTTTKTNTSRVPSVRVGCWKPHNYHRIGLALSLRPNRTRS